MKIYFENDRLIVEDGTRMAEHSPSPGTLVFGEDIDTNKTATIKSGSTGIIIENVLLSSIVDKVGALYTESTFRTMLINFFVNALVEGYKMSAYLENPTIGIAINAGVDTKAAITTVFAEVPPRGFDTFITPQGIAWRFIGSGLGNGDTGMFCMSIASGLKADFGAADRVLFNVKRRHYAEADWLNALAIPGYQISRKLPNKDLGAIALNSPCFTLSDGDLIETSLNTDSDITLIIDTFSVEIKQI